MMDNVYVNPRSLSLQRFWFPRLIHQHDKIR